MNLLKALAPIAAGIGAGYLFGGGGTSSEITGELARSFLFSQGKSSKEFSAPFQAASITRPRRVEELTRGSPTAAPAQLRPVQQLVSNSPRLETAMLNLYQNASNAQVREMFGKYSNDMTPTLRQGRRTLAVEQPGDIEVV